MDKNYCFLHKINFDSFYGGTFLSGSFSHLILHKGQGMKKSFQFPGTPHNHFFFSKKKPFNNTEAINSEQQSCLTSFPNDR